MTIKNAVYKVSNGVNFDEISFKTTAESVVEDDNHKFVTKEEKEKLGMYPLNTETAAFAGDYGTNGVRTGVVELGNKIAIIYDWALMTAEADGNVKEREVFLDASIKDKIDYSLGGVQLTCYPYETWGYFAGYYSYSGGCFMIRGENFAGYRKAFCQIMMIVKLK